MSALIINKTNYAHILNLRDQLCSLRSRATNNHYFKNWTKLAGSTRIQTPIQSGKKWVKIGLNRELGAKTLIPSKWAA